MIVVGIVIVVDVDVVDVDHVVVVVVVVVLVNVRGGEQWYGFMLHVGGVSGKLVDDGRHTRGRIVERLGFATVGLVELR